MKLLTEHTEPNLCLLVKTLHVRAPELPRAHLLNLPYEIRSQILSYLLVKPTKCITFGYMELSGHRSRELVTRAKRKGRALDVNQLLAKRYRNSTRLRVAILQTCWQLYSEGSDILFKYNDFAFMGSFIKSPGAQQSNPANTLHLFSTPRIDKRMFIQRLEINGCFIAMWDSMRSPTGQKLYPVFVFDQLKHLTLRFSDRVSSETVVPRKNRRTMSLKLFLRHEKKWGIFQVQEKGTIEIDGIYSFELDDALEAACRPD